jgi:NADH-quinone oxidoreductase subunit F
MKWSFIDQNWPLRGANADGRPTGQGEIMEGNPFRSRRLRLQPASAPGGLHLSAGILGMPIPDQRIADMQQAGYLGSDLLGTPYSLRMYTHLGAGAYICGEETAMLESIEGKRGQPRIRPPFPAVHGLYGKPTVVNNVETLTNVPLIVANGADWYKTLGTPDSAGVKVFSLSGRVRKPGNYELPFGSTFRELIYDHGGGVQDSRRVRAIMPAGASSSLILVDDKVLDTPMDYASVRTLDADLGSASLIIIDDTVPLDWVIQKTIHFFTHESCGKCTPCREGTYWMKHLIDRIRATGAQNEDVELLLNVARQMQQVPVSAGSSQPWRLSPASSALQDQTRRRAAA